MGVVDPDGGRHWDVEFLLSTRTDWFNDQCFLLLVNFSLNHETTERSMGETKWLHFYKRRTLKENSLEL